MVFRYGDARDPLRSVLGPEVGARLKPIWGLDPEGEIQGVWRDLGVPRVWCMMGKSYYATIEQLLKQVQETLLCAGSIRSILPCVRPPNFTRVYLRFADMFYRNQSD
jgi:hypothetical protein